MGAVVTVYLADVKCHNNLKASPPSKHGTAGHGPLEIGQPERFVRTVKRGQKVLAMLEKRHWRFQDNNDND